MYRQHQFSATKQPNSQQYDEQRSTRITISGIGKAGGTPAGVPTDTGSIDKVGWPRSKRTGPVSSAGDLIRPECFHKEDRGITARLVWCQKCSYFRIAGADAIGSCKRRKDDSRQPISGHDRRPTTVTNPGR